MRVLAVLIGLLVPFGVAAQAVTAILEPAEIVEIRPTVAGQLMELLVQDGAQVEAGAALALIDSRQQAQRVALARAVAEADGRLQRAQAQIAQARGLLDRMESARTRGAVQSWEVEQAAQAVALAEADHQVALDGQDQARAQLALEQAILEDYTLRAPFAGVVLEVRENRGARVDPQSVVLAFAQLATLEATAFVPLDWVQDLTVGEPLDAVVEGAGTQTTQVIVRAIDPRIDPASRTLRLRLTLDNAAGGFQPGATLILQAPPLSQ